ncbi:MAG: DUF2007 domain-containing protein [Planctomycetaceae bacterium]|nr:DUF2007 domain-containing protein [Planctomycetaceae bacterium]
MAEDRTTTNTVIVARVASLQQADIIKSVLEGNGIDALVPDSLTSTTMTHMLIKRKPKGYPVLVLEKDLEAAREVLAQKYDPAELEAAAAEFVGQEAQEDQDRQEVSAETLLSELQARRALVCSVLWIIFPPLVLLVPWFALQAARAAAADPATRTRAYRRDLRLAVVLVLAPLAAVGLFLLAHR